MAHTSRQRGFEDTLCGFDIVTHIRRLFGRLSVRPASEVKDYLGIANRRGLLCDWRSGKIDRHSIVRNPARATRDPPTLCLEIVGKMTADEPVRTGEEGFHDAANALS
jgi:hypothetical protein